jgi:hypothetical protein
MISVLQLVAWYAVMTLLAFAVDKAVVRQL